MMANIESFKEETILASPPFDIDHNEDCDTHDDTEFSEGSNLPPTSKKKYLLQEMCRHIQRNVEY